MEILDLSPLHSNNVEEITIDNDYIITKEYYENTDIIDIKDLHVSGNIKRLTDDDDYMNLDVVGNLILQDSITLEAVKYPFSFKIEGNMTEILENCPKSLDILEFLWENIVLEVPLKFTKETDLSKFHGDGWRLISEDEEKKNNNPFNDLLKEIGKE